MIKMMNELNPKTIVILFDLLLSNVKKSIYLACLGFSHLAFWRQERFLWSVHAMSWCSTLSSQWHWASKAQDPISPSCPRCNCVMTMSPRYIKKTKKKKLLSISLRTSFTIARKTAWSAQASSPQHHTSSQHFPIVALVNLEDDGRRFCIVASWCEKQSWAVVRDTCSVSSNLI